jgi:hypothetical protein
MFDLTWLYAFGLQTVAVVALVYLVSLLGARAFAASYPGPHSRPASSRKLL